MYEIQIRVRRGNFYGKEHAKTCSKILFRELCKNGSTDRDAVWVVDSGGPKEACVTYTLAEPGEYD